MATFTDNNVVLTDKVQSQLSGWINSSSDMDQAEIFNLTSDDYLQLLNKEYADRIFPAVIVLVVLMVLGAIGNFFVLFVYSCRSKRSTITRFIQALAVFDLLSCCLAIPGEIVDMTNNYTFGSYQLCKVIRTVNLFCTLASGATLVVVAADRYKRICCPMRRQISPKGAVIILSCCALASMAVAIPTTFLYGSRTVSTDRTFVKGSDCSINDRFAGTLFPLAYNGLQMLLFVVGATALIILYSLVGRKVCIHVHQQKIRRKSLCLGRSRFTPGHTSMFSSGSINMDNHCQVELIAYDSAKRDIVAAKCQISEKTQDNIMTVAAECKFGPNYYKVCGDIPAKLKNTGHNNQCKQNEVEIAINNSECDENNANHSCYKSVDEILQMTNSNFNNDAEIGIIMDVLKTKSLLDVMNASDIKNYQVGTGMNGSGLKNSELETIMNVAQIMSSEIGTGSNVSQTKNSNVGNNIDVPCVKKFDDIEISGKTGHAINGTETINFTDGTKIDLSKIKNSNIETLLDASENTKYIVEITMDDPQINSSDICLCSVQEAHIDECTKETDVQVDDTDKELNCLKQVPQHSKTDAITHQNVSLINSVDNFNSQTITASLSSKALTSGTFVTNAQTQINIHKSLSETSCQNVVTIPVLSSSNQPHSACTNRSSVTPPIHPLEKLAESTSSLPKTFEMTTNCKDSNSFPQTASKINMFDKNSKIKRSLLNCSRPDHYRTALKRTRTNSSEIKINHSQTKQQKMDMKECESQRENELLLQQKVTRKNVNLKHHLAHVFLKENSEFGAQDFTNSTMTGTDSKADTVGEDERYNKRERLQTNGTMRTTLMLFLITIVYILSFMPHLVIMTIKALNENSLKGHGASWELAQNLIIRSYFINSMANPIIYSFFSKNFFAECTKSISCCCKKQALK